MGDDFQSLERPGQRIKVDATGKRAVPIIAALASGSRSDADAMFRDLDALQREVLAMVSRYFAWTPPADAPKRKRKPK